MRKCGMRVVTRGLPVAVSLLVLLGAAVPVGAVTVYHLSPSADAMILSAAPGEATGALSHTLSVATYPGGDERRSLLRFDLSTLPAGLNVTSAQLVLYTYQTTASSNAAGQPMEVYRLTHYWAEASVTWSSSSPYGGVYWNGADGFFVGTTGVAGTSPYASSSAQPTTSGTPVLWDVTSLVSEWYTGSVPNYGLLLRSYVGNQLYFYSREATYPPGVRPVLHVTLDAQVAPASGSANSSSAAVPEPDVRAAIAVGLLAVAMVRTRR